MKNLKSAPLTGIHNIDRYLVEQDSVNLRAVEIVEQFYNAQKAQKLTDQEIAEHLNYYFPTLYEHINPSTLTRYIKTPFVNIFKNHKDYRIRRECLINGQALDELIGDENDYVRAEYIHQSLSDYYPYLINDKSTAVRKALAKTKECAPQMLLDEDFFVRNEAYKTIKRYHLFEEENVIQNIKQITDVPLQEDLLNSIYNQELLTHLKKNGQTRAIRATANSWLRTLKAFEQFSKRIQKEEKYIKGNRWFQNMITPFIKVASQTTINDHTISDYQYDDSF